MSLLSTLAKYGDFLPNGFITHLLEVRLTMLPPVAKQAAKYNTEIIKNFLHDIHKSIDKIDRKRNMNRLFDCRNLVIHDSDKKTSETFGETTNRYNKKYNNNCHS